MKYLKPLLEEKKLSVTTDFYRILLFTQEGKQESEVWTCGGCDMEYINKSCSLKPVLDCRVLLSQLILIVYSSCSDSERLVLKVN